MKKFLQRIARQVSWLVAGSLLIIFLFLLAVVVKVDVDAMSLALILTLVAMLLTGLALLATAHQIDQGREMTRILKDQEREMTRILKDLSQSVSTEYVGAFPEFVPKITELLGTAKKDVKIMCDIPAYGKYSNPEEYRRYFSALVSLDAERVVVSLTVYTEKKENEALAVQFNEPFEKLQGQNLKEHEGRIGKKIQNIEQLRKSLACENEKECKRFEYEYVTHFTRVEKHMPVYFWIIDGQVAIFSFAGLRRKPPAVAFKTVDRMLINTFLGILNDVKSKDST